MKKIKLLPIFISSTLSLAGCEGIPIGKVDNSHDETLIVLSHKAECKLFNAANSTLCLKVNFKDNDNLLLLEKDEIKGFSYEWGFDYELEVEVEDLIDPPADASSKKYTFKKEIKKSLVSTVQAFDISISEATTGKYIKKVSGKDNTYKIFDDKEVTCLPDVCAELDQMVADDKAILMELKHQSPTSKPLELIKIKCNETRAKFTEKCLTN
jgi:hypothetical protein